MMKNTTHKLRARLGTPRLVQRGLIYSGVALAGAVVAASASYAVVSALYPRQAAPAAIAVTQPYTILNDRNAPTLLASAPATRQIDVTPLETLPNRIETAVDATPTAPMADTLVVSTKSVTDIAVPLPDTDTFDAAPAAAPVVAQIEDTMPARALSAPATRPALETTAAPSAFAALAAADAMARTEATLDFSAAEPVPGAEAETPAPVAVAAADIPRIRPLPRPDTVPVVLAVAEAPGVADAIPALRPQPRPEVVRVAAAQPQTTAAEPAPRRSGGLFSSGSSSCGKTLARSMPRRSSGSADGSAFFAALGGLSGTDRDQRVIDELARGNMPGFLRDLQPVTFRGEDARGVATEIVICVTPDYLALGSDRDYVRVPLGLPAAAHIAGRFGMTLPTPRMVDAIYAQADVRLSPSPMQAGPQMSSTAYFLRHNATIEGQLKGRHGLVAGQKKDVVMASRMASAPGRVAIYGWHRSTTSPIQPVSTVHGANYADYSHGIRLVSKTAYLNGRAVNLDELLESSRYAYLLNQEGPLPGPVIRTASR